MTVTVLQGVQESKVGVRVVPHDQAQLELRVAHPHFLWRLTLRLPSMLALQPSCQQANFEYS